MCVGDFRLGRVVRANPVAWAISGSVNLSIPANPQRVGLSIALGAAPTAGNTYVTVSSGGIIVSVVAIQDPFRHFTLIEHGDLPTKAFTIAQGANATVGSWTEYTMPEEYLNAAIEQFKTQYHIGR